jgi:hypothetical protein
VEIHSKVQWLKVATVFCVASAEYNQTSFNLHLSTFSELRRLNTLLF